MPSGNLPAALSFSVNHSQNALPSFQLTRTTGYTSRCGTLILGSLQLFPSSEIQGWGGALAVISQFGSNTWVLPPGFSASVTYPVSSVNLLNCPTLTSVRPIQKPSLTSMARGASPS